MTTTGVAAGVPFVALPPAGGARPGAPVVVAWHPMDPPDSESAFAAAVPLEGVDAWRFYLGLPMCGARLPEGGADELMRLGYQDAVMNLQGPIAEQGVAEFPAALAELRERFEIGDGPLALMGGSMGSAIAQLVLAETGISVRAAVLISPISRLRDAVEATGRRYGVVYPWHEEALKVARRMDFVKRANEMSGPAVRIIVGGEDDEAGFIAPARELSEALPADLVVVDGMPHAFVGEHARAVDMHATEWLRREMP